MIVGSGAAKRQLLVLATFTVREVADRDLGLPLAFAFAPVRLGRDDTPTRDECGDAAEDTAHDAASGRGSRDLTKHCIEPFAIHCDTLL